MNPVLNKIKSAWGSNQSRGYRLGAWAVAIGAFTAMTYLQNSGKSGEAFDAAAHNKKIMDTQKK